MLARSFSDDIGDQGHASSLDVGHHTKSWNTKFTLLEKTSKLWPRARKIKLQCSLVISPAFVPAYFGVITRVAL
jgi:hypothetical protein